MKAAPRQQMRLVVAVIAGRHANTEVCVKSARRQGLPVHIFDTTQDQLIKHLFDGDPGVVVSDISWVDSFASARNDGLELLELRGAAFTHVLWLDTDEVLNSVDGLANLELRPFEIGCPLIQDPEFSTQGVGRLATLHLGIHFEGHVHEYLVDADHTPLAYVPVDIRIMHAGYADRDRAPRNVPLLQKQILCSPDNLRWRPFLARDGARLLHKSVLLQINKEQAALSTSGEPIGGIGSIEYMRMMVRAVCMSMLARGDTRAARSAADQYRQVDIGLHSEVLYFQLMSVLLEGQIDLDLFAQVFQYRDECLASPSVQDMPWLDAAIAFGLELSGETDAADAYRQESTPFTDELFLDSRVRLRHL